MKAESYFPWQFRTDCLFFVVVLIAASNYVVCKWALEHVPPFTLLAVRYLLAVAVLSSLIIPHLKSLSKALLVKSFYLGLLLSASVICWQYGITRAEQLGPASFIVSTDGLMVSVFAFLIFGQALSRAVLLALPVALLGLAMLTLEEGMSVAASDIWFLLSAIGFSLHILYTNRYARYFNAMTFAWGQMLVVGLISLAAAIAIERQVATVAAFEAAKYEVIYLAVVATALRFSLQNYAQKRTTAVRAGFLFVLEPIAVTWLGWLLLSETLSPTQILGCSVILGALLLTRIPPRERIAVRAISESKPV